MSVNKSKITLPSFPWEQSDVGKDTDSRRVDKISERIARAINDDDPST